ncbi:MAG: hypothetical protein IT580_07920 [Verrucomicrobiales bacterium]|nr:hypothetical protein [Verrucomicrobiales bacterium]
MRLIRVIASLCGSVMVVGTTWEVAVAGGMEGGAQGGSVVAGSEASESIRLQVQQRRVVRVPTQAGAWYQIERSYDAGQWAVVGEGFVGAGGFQERFLAPAEVDGFRFRVLETSNAGPRKGYHAVEAPYALSRLSASGRNAVGVRIDVVPPRQEVGRWFRWADPGGAFLLPQPAGLTGNYSHLNINDEGTVIWAVLETVEGNPTISIRRLVRWTAGEGSSVVPMPGARGIQSAFASRDGMTVAGTFHTEDQGVTTTTSYRWTKERGLEGLPGPFRTAGISEDGRWAVGFLGSEASLMRFGQEAEALGTLTGADGTVLVPAGVFLLPGDPTPDVLCLAGGSGMVWRWRSRDRRFEPLGQVPRGRPTIIAGANVEGSLVVGTSFISDSETGPHYSGAWIWRAGVGMRELGEVFDTAGVPRPWNGVGTCFGMSRDGAVILGGGIVEYPFGSSRGGWVLAISGGEASTPVTEVPARLGPGLRLEATRQTGKRYQLQQSLDLQQWTDWGDAWMGEGNDWHQEVATSEPMHQFFRLRESPGLESD